MAAILFEVLYGQSQAHLDIASISTRYRCAFGLLTQGYLARCNLTQTLTLTLTQGFQATLQPMNSKAQAPLVQPPEIQSPFVLYSRDLVT